jgi:hypothetical protein
MRNNHRTSKALDDRSRATLPGLVLSASIVLAVCMIAVLTWLTLNQPLLDAYGFRQTQTAISSYWMGHGHAAFFDYVTPVLGAPWIVPFEAPIYQWLAFLLSLTGIPLDASGRLVSLSCFFGAVWLGYRIIRRLLPDDSYAAELFVLLVLFSPLYLFWSRTFMIETCAIFFGMAWLFFAIRPLDRLAVPWLIASTPLGVLAALTKITTFPAFVAGYGIYAATEIVRTRRLAIAPLAAATASVAVSLIAMLLWTAHADAVKSANPFTVQLVSANLSGWNFGTLNQRISAKLWQDVMPTRILPDVLGYAWPALLIGMVFAGLRGRQSQLAAACAILFLVPVALFPNLIIIHDYYIVGSAIFGCAAAAFLISEVAAVGRRYWAAALVMAMIGGSLLRIYWHQWPLATQPLATHPFYVAGELVRNNTPEDTALIVLGIDWTSEVHYIAQRKGVAFPGWGGVELTRNFAANPDQFMGGLKTAALVDCRRYSKYGPAIEPLIDEFATRFISGANKLSGEDGCAVYVRAP